MAIYTQGMLAGATMVQAQQQQQLVHETDSGILASVPVLSFSASRNAIPLPVPRGHMAQFSAPRTPTGQIEIVQDAGGSRYQRQS